MKISINRLTDMFPPPLNPVYPVKPNDFSLFKLAHPPPKALIDLYEIYGEGDFECGTGDHIRLLLPSYTNVATYKYIMSTYSTVYGDVMDIDELFQQRLIWFNEGPETETREIFLWGSTLNGVDLFYVWLSEKLGWAILCMDHQIYNSACYFRHPASFILEVFWGGMSNFFPPAQGPFRFKPRLHP